jgi:hypothetical protein
MRQDWKTSLTWIPILCYVIVLAWLGYECIMAIASAWR